MNTAKQIRRAREALGESQGKFSKRFNVDQSTVHRWENGQAPVSGPALIVLKHLLWSISTRSVEAAE